MPFQLMTAINLGFGLGRASFVAQLVKNLPAMQETWVRFLGWEDPLEKGKAAQTVKRLPTMREAGFNPWVGKIPWRRKWQPTPVPLPGKSHGQKILVGYSPWGLKELDTTEQLHFLSLGLDYCDIE